MPIRTIPFSDIDILDIGNRIQLAGCILTGKGGNYLLVFPDEDLEDATNTAALQRVEMSLGDWVNFLNQSDVVNVEIQGPPKVIARKSARQIDANISWAVFRRDGYRCRYCGREVPLTVDHIICWESGGPSVESNLLSACRRCNRDRGNMPYEHWLKSTRYIEVSCQLGGAQKEANIAVVEMLPAIEALRVQRQRSR